MSGWERGGRVNFDCLPHGHDPIEDVEHVLTYLQVLARIGDPVLVEVIGEADQRWLTCRGALHYAGYRGGDRHDPLPRHVFDVGPRYRGSADPLSDYRAGASLAIYPGLFERGHLNTLDDGCYFDLAIRQRGWVLSISDIWERDPSLLGHEP